MKLKKQPHVVVRMVDKLKESGLTLDDAEQLGFIPCTEEQSATLGLSRTGEGFLLPYFAVDGETELTMFRYRYFDCEVQQGFLSGVKLRKYDQPLDTDPEAYFPRLLEWSGIVADKGIPIFITEGELKSACAAKNGFACVGIGGVFNFGRKSRHQTLIPSLEAIVWQGRQVYICYDSDAKSNRDILMAESRLARALTDKGAYVRIVRIPEDGDAKVGLDDFIVKNGKDAFDELINATEEFGTFEALHQLNTEVIYVKHPSMIVEFPKDDHPDNQSRYRMMKVTTFVREAYADRKYIIPVGDKLVERKAAADWVEWKARSIVDSVVYAPGEERVINSNQLNLWEGWGATPVKGDVSLFLQLFKHLFANAEDEDRKWLLQWLACPLQRPGVKMNTAVVVWSLTQGSGKSILGYTMARIYGKNYSEVTKPELSGAFNSWASNKQFVMGEEITGGSGREVADLLKNMITGREVNINAKYVPTYTTKNCINYYFTSNHQDAFFVNQSDRRYFIHEVNGEKLPDSFWVKYDQWYRSQEGINALFYHLLYEVDTSDFNPQAEAPHTRSRMEMIEAGRSEHLAWCEEMFQHPDNVLRTDRASILFKLYTAEDLLKVYAPDEQRRRYPVTARALSVALKEAGFMRVRDGTPIDIGGGRRVRLWVVRDRDKLRDLSAGEAGKMYQDERAGKPTGSSKFSKGGDTK